MVQLAEQDVAPETIEATVNYIANDGQELFTYTGGPGSLDVRTGGTVDPRQVTIHNARRAGDRFTLDRDGFRFVRHDTKMADFFDEEIETKMERFVTLVEPVLLVMMGIVIAALLLALYMPLFQLPSVLT